MKKWEEFEIEYILTNAETMTDKEISKKLNRTTKSIGAKRVELGLIKSRIKDRVGDKIDNVTVIRNTGEKDKNGCVIWECLTDDGKIVNISSRLLYPGKTKLTKGIPQDVRNGRSKERLYNVWKNIRHKCVCPSNGSYEHYGAKGISCCKEWDDYEVFKSWAYANGYHENHNRNECTIDRIDFNGDYCPENCRIVNMNVQAANRKNFGKLPYYGLIKINDKYVMRITVNGKKINLGRSKYKEDIPHLIDLRNNYIDEHNLPHQKNIFDPNIPIP